MNPIDQLVKLFALLQERLAPTNITQQIIYFNSTSDVGSPVIKLYDFHAPYNWFLNCLSQGTVFGYYGDVNSQSLPPVPDLVFRATNNPLPIPIAVRHDKRITLVVDNSQGFKAQGAIHLGYY